MIDGATRLLGIVGDPIAQVRSPPLWTALFRHNGINAVCVPYHVKPPALERFLNGLREVENLIGLLVTIPHKFGAARFAASVTPRSRMVGTANILRKRPDGGWEGDILDGVGFVLALQASGQSIAGRRAIVVGAGGAGSAIAFALAEAGAASLAIADIDPARAEGLARRITALAGVPSSVSSAKAEGFDLVVNASPLGMKPDDPIPCDLTGLTSGTIVGDVVISRTLTPVLRDAQARGCHVQPGAAMTDHQVTAMASFLGLTTGDWGPGAIRTVLRE